MPDTGNAKEELREERWKVEKGQDQQGSISHVKNSYL